MINLVNLDNALSNQEQQDVLDKMVEIRLILEKFTVNLSKEERKKARNVSNSRLAYVDNMLRAAKQYEKVLPRDIDIAHFEKATKEYAKLKDIFIKMEELHEMIDDTIVSTGQLMMHYTDHIYSSLQLARGRDAGLDNVMEAIEESNKRKFGKRYKSSEDKEDLETED